MIVGKTSVTDNIKSSNESSDSGKDNYKSPSFELTQPYELTQKVELTHTQLREAIIYSEILGKPKCKTRRRR